MSDAEGRYELALSGPRPYRVQVQPRGSNGTSIGRTLEVPEGGLRDLELVVPSGRIAGSVRRADDSDSIWARVSLTYRSGALDPGDVSIEDVRQYGGLVQIEPGDPTPTAAGFDFQDLPAGTYALEVTTHDMDYDVANLVLPVPDQIAPPGRLITLGPNEQVIDLKLELPRKDR
jgi:hypothetical protein